MIVMCFNDKEPYLTQAKVVLKSLELNSGNIPVSLYLINFNNNIFNTKRCINVKLDDLNYITAYSLVAMYDTLLKCKTNILWLDADVIVRSDLQGIFSDVKPNTLKILKRKSEHENSIFNTGVVAVGYSEETLKLLKHASELAMSNPQWTADQFYLYESYKKYKNKINLVNLLDHVKWHDIGGRERKNVFSSNSVIWHCKSIHFDNAIYQNEYKYYEGMIDEDTI